MVKCYIKNGGSSKQCLLNGIHTEQNIHTKVFRKESFINTKKVLNLIDTRPYK